MKRTLCTVVSALAFVLMLALPSASSAQARCPWLNAATAAGVLGGEVQMTVTEPVEPRNKKGVGAAMYSDQVRNDRFDVTCDFSRKAYSGVYSLNIVVKTMTDTAKDYPSVLALCPGPKVALRGIGNEAVQCVNKEASAAGQEEVIARVRDRSFVLTIHHEINGQKGVDISALSNETRNVAEQVAGSLF